eukprot:COSAG06_NODE_50781_length_316_cov_0.857143_2_plen_33_part_01
MFDLPSPAIFEDFDSAPAASLCLAESASQQAAG